MVDYTVKVIGDQHVPVFQRGGKLVTVRRVQITVGDYGPFFHDFYPPNDQAANVREWIVQRVQDTEAAHTV